MNHKAVYALHTNVVTVDDGTGAFDKDGNKVEIDIDAVNAWIDPEDYKFKRLAEYPPIREQLDTIFHKGLDVWKEQIQAVKDKHPKGVA